MNAHYFFPPAEAYPLNRCLFRLKSEPAYRRRFAADREAAMSEAALGPDARAALTVFDRDRLVALGAHPYLVFMADLRLKMERAPAAFERF
jgi:Aromatic-ring-opening dioxygenase LigAB, LigA subunit